MTAPQKTGMQIPGNRTQFFTFTKTWQETSKAMAEALSITAPFLRYNLGAVIVARSNGNIDTAEANRHARTIAMKLTIAANLMKFAARLAVQARRLYERHVDEAPQHAKGNTRAVFDADR